MNNMVPLLISAIVMGVGATLTTDLWGLFLKRIFGIASSNYCLVGRWLLYMRHGTFKHSSLASAPQKSSECIVGWIAHYMVGMVFAITFVMFANERWLQHPTLIPAMLFGMGTVVMPFFIMQPAFGLGWAASKAADPTQARLRSLMTHTAFGLGLYLSGWLVRLSLAGGGS